MKRGFTLVEVLSVIIILGVLSVIATFAINKVIKENTQDAYNLQIEYILDGAKLWASKNVFEMPENEGEFVIITLSDLKNNGFVEDEIVNPITRQQFNNNLQIKITLQNNDYNYQIVEEN